MSYSEALRETMTWLGKQSDTIFLGQSVAYSGNGLFDTLRDVPIEKRIELPVAEDMQMGMSIGLSMGGKVPISIFPRMDFLVCAMNQLINHLDKIEQFTHGEYRAHVIIRTSVGSIIPLNPGVQHCQNHTDMLRHGLANIKIIELTKSEDIMAAYIDAYNSSGSSLLVEFADLMRK